MPFKTSGITYGFKRKFDEKADIYGIMNVVKPTNFVGQARNLNN